MAKRLSELGIMIGFGYTLWMIVSRPKLKGFFAQRAVTRLASFINRPSKQNYSIIFIFLRFEESWSSCLGINATCRRPP